MKTTNWSAFGEGLIQIGKGKKHFNKLLAKRKKQKYKSKKTEITESSVSIEALKDRYKDLK